MALAGSPKPLAAHQVMTSDRVRVGAYARAIEKLVHDGDVVLDLGTGTGILAMLAAKAGARTVYAVDVNERVLATAAELAEKNGLEQQVRTMHSHFDDLELPEQVDVIVQELYGFIGLEDGMATYVPRLAARWLKPGGRLIPAGVQIFLAPFSSSEFAKRLSFSATAEFGLDYSPAERNLAERWFPAVIEAADLIAPPAMVFGSDFSEPAPRTIGLHAVWQCEREAPLTGLAGWFEAPMGNGETLSTSPRMEKTHWGQMLLPVAGGPKVERGATITADVSLNVADSRGVLDWRVEAGAAVFETSNLDWVFRSRPKR